MKLSDIFGWEKKAKRTMPLDLNNTAFYVNDFREWNNALTSCDREIDREALQRVLNEVKSCPNPGCGDKGWYVGEATSREYVTRDMALDAGDINLEGSVYKEEQQEQVQCEFCYTNKYSKFNLSDHIISTMPTWLKRSKQ